MAQPSSIDHEELRAECQRFLASFRVLELKELLKQCGQSTKGRKSELFQRANDMLQFGSPKFQTKIREVYEKSNCRRQPSYGRAAHKITSPVKSGETVIKNASQAYIVHPDVKFKTLPFFTKMETIIRPTALVSSGVSGHSSLSMRVKFHLTPQQIHHIYVSKTSTGTYQTQILVRFCLQETTCDQNDYYPKQCYVKVNGHNCPIAGYHPHLSTRQDYKRNGQPINITNFVKTSPTEINEVTVYWAHDIMLPQGYCLGIEIAKVVSSSDLLQTLKAKGVRSPDMSRALVKEKFVVDKDSEVAATSMKVSLLCPIGKMRMSYPCRTTNCTHLQCFDASIFYQMNEKRARWVCPVCDKQAIPEDLFIDGLFMEICEESPSSDTIIEFMGDGSWRPSTESTGSCLNVDTPDKRGSSPISLDSSSDGGKKKSDVVIDLTESSDEEDNAGTQQDDEEEEEEEEEEEDERQERRGRNASGQRNVHILTNWRRQSEDTDSDGAPSSTSSTALGSPPPPTLSLKPSTFPRLSVTLPTRHHTSSQPATMSLPTPSQSGRMLSPTSPTSSTCLHPSASSSTISPADSGATTPTASSSSSRPMSVIIEGRSHPISSNYQESSSRPHSNSSSRSHSQSVVRLHSRSRKHSSSTHPYSSASSSSSHHHHHHRRHHHHTHSSGSSSRVKSATSHSSRPASSQDCTSGATSSGPGSSSTSSIGGEGGRGEGPTVLSQGLGSHQLAPYFPLHPNGFPTPGDSVLTSNIFSIDENIMNMLRAGLFPMASVQTRNHTDTDD